MLTTHSSSSSSTNHFTFQKRSTAVWRSALLCVAPGVDRCSPSLHLSFQFQVMQCKLTFELCNLSHPMTPIFMIMTPLLLACDGDKKLHERDDVFPTKCSPEKALAASHFTCHPHLDLTPKGGQRTVPTRSSLKYSLQAMQPAWVGFVSPLVGSVLF